MANQPLWNQLVFYFTHNGMYLLQQFGRHFLISFYGVLLAAIVGIPLGIYMANHFHLGDFIISVANVIQTVPSLAMLSIIMLWLGLGVNTVIITIFLYSLLPILKNTYTGMRNVDPNTIDSARGMGMTTFQLLYMVKLPLAMSVIMSGIRTAMVVAIGNTAIGAFVGAGGLGDLIIRGTNATDGAPLILAGALPTAIMAIVTDLVIGLLQKHFEPTGYYKQDEE